MESSRIRSKKERIKTYQLLKRVNFIKVMKVAIGSTIAILLSDWLGLAYSASAGLIALLSITDTKKDTIGLAVNRFFAFIISTTIAFVLFESFGYSTPMFGVYLLIFMGVCCILGLSSAVSLCSVLATHYLAEQSMALSVIANEASLFVIGAGIGVLLNLYMPDKTQMILDDMKIIEQDMKKILLHIEQVLSAACEFQLDKENKSVEDILADTREHMEEAMKRAYDNMNNNLMSDTRYYIQYIDMRKTQVMKLNELCSGIAHLTYLPPQAVELATFTHEIRESFHEYNNAVGLLEKAHKIREAYKKQEIPKSRDEFENRAILYQVMIGLEEFLMLKQEFVKELTPKQIETFWKK